MIRTISRAISWLAPAAVYIAIFMLLEVDQGAAFRTSAIFLAFSYLMLAVSFVAVPRSRIAPILGMPLVLVASIYLTIELIAATVFIYAPSISYPVVIISQLILAMVFVVVFVTTLSSNQAIAAQLEQQHADVLVLKSAVTRIAALERVTSNPHLAEPLGRLAEGFRYSPTSRSRETFAEDAEIGQALDGLELLMRGGAPSDAVISQIAAISESLAARNSAIKLRQ